MIVNESNLSILFTGFTTAFRQEFEGVTTAYKEIAMVVPSTTREELYGWLGQSDRLFQQAAIRALGKVGFGSAERQQ